MRFLYATDLHGDIRKYDMIYSYAKENRINLIHLGADLLPKNSEILKIQKKFVKGFLKDYYARAKEDGKILLAFWGNDDIYSRKPYFRDYGQLLDETPYEKDGYTFTAYGYVPDFPFGLKTACKLDYEGWVVNQPYLTNPVDINESGFCQITDIHEYFLKKGTLETDLKSFPGGNNIIAAIHCPPDSSGLDVCRDNRRVGSRSITRWIHAKQPLLVLSGHIHESPAMSGIWKEKIGDTLVIQPGQELNSAVFVLIEINDNKISVERLVKPM